MCRVLLALGLFKQSHSATSLALAVARQEQRARDASSGGSLRHRLSLKPAEVSAIRSILFAYGGVVAAVAYLEQVRESAEARQAQTLSDPTATTGSLVQIGHHSLSMKLRC